MYNFLWVALGGAMGSLLRYGLNLGFPLKENEFPVGTFLSNMLASLILGITASLLISKFPNEPFLKYFIIVGICGGFSTFSSFAFELFNLHHAANWNLLITYSIISVVLSVILIYLGFVITKTLIP